MNAFKLFRTSARAVTIAACLVVPAAHAATIYDNPTDATNASCAFSTVCAAQAGWVGDFAAQKFSVSTAVTIASASYTIFDLGTLTTAANWKILATDGAEGLPGTVLASGTSSMVSSIYLGKVEYFYNIDKQFFNIGAVSLTPGDYYFAVQAISPVFETYLSQGISSGAAEYIYGRWQPAYTRMTSIAVGLYDTPVSSVPEPESYAMMLAGLGLMGFTASRRKKS